MASRHWIFTFVTSLRLEYVSSFTALKWKTYKKYCKINSSTNVLMYSLITPELQDYKNFSAFNIIFNRHFTKARIDCYNEASLWFIKDKTCLIDNLFYFRKAKCAVTQLKICFILYAYILHTLATRREIKRVAPDDITIQEKTDNYYCYVTNIMMNILKNFIFLFRKNNTLWLYKSALD
jgi:hypothetical protein